MADHRIAKKGDAYTLSCDGEIIGSETFTEEQLLEDDVAVLTWAQKIMEKHEKECRGVQEHLDT